MKRRPKAKPRVTQLDRIERRLRHISALLPQRPMVLELDARQLIKAREHCAVLASHNRRLLEENETLKRWLTRLQARSTGTTPAGPDASQHT